MRMHPWLASIFMGAACLGISLFDGAVAVGALGALLGWSISSTSNDATEVLDELDRIRKTQLVQVYDGGENDEVGSSL